MRAFLPKAQWMNCILLGHLGTLIKIRELTGDTTGGASKCSKNKRLSIFPLGGKIPLFRGQTSPQIQKYQNITAFISQASL